MAPRIGLRHWIFARRKSKKDPYSHARAAALFARATPAYVPYLYLFTTHRASDGARRPSTTVTRSMSTLLCKFSPRAHFFRQHRPSRFCRNSPELPDSKNTTLGTIMCSTFAYYAFMFSWFLTGARRQYVFGLCTLCTYVFDTFSMFYC